MEKNFQFSLGLKKGLASTDLISPPYFPSGFQTSRVDTLHQNKKPNLFALFVLRTFNASPDKFRKFIYPWGTASMRKMRVMGFFFKTGGNKSHQNHKIRKITHMYVTIQAGWMKRLNSCTHFQGGFSKEGEKSFSFCTPRFTAEVWNSLLLGFMDRPMNTEILPTQTK